jgi:hypothetical protein
LNQHWDPFSAIINKKIHTQIECIKSGAAIELFQNCEFMWKIKCRESVAMLNRAYMPTYMATEEVSTSTFSYTKRLYDCINKYCLLIEPLLLQST